MNLKLRLLAATTVALTLTATPTVASAQDPIQAPQAAAALTDTDGDALPDIWEINGYDADGDGTIDVDLPAFGASPTKKDIFVETDYLPGELPNMAVYDKITKVFAEAPVQNPDGTNGIQIHLDAGPAGGKNYNLGGGNEIENVTDLLGVATVKAAKDKHQAAARKSIFRYMWWADKFGTKSYSGQAYRPGDTFLISVGKTYWKDLSDDGKVGTFVHELGHTLGLAHGGDDNINSKPNYLSVLNYAFQFSGVPLTNGGNLFGYSSGTLDHLKESSLDESLGLGAAAAGYKAQFINSQGKKMRTRYDASQPIDWNGNGVIDSGPVSANLNGEGGDGQTLADFNDWANLKYKAGLIGNGPEEYSTQDGAGTSELESNEATSEIYKVLVAARLSTMPHKLKP